MYIDTFPNKNVRLEKKNGVAFITLNLKGKNNLPTLTNLPVVKLAQHTVKIGESYLNILLTSEFQNCRLVS